MSRWLGLSAGDGGPSSRLQQTDDDKVPVSSADFQSLAVPFSSFFQSLAVPFLREEYAVFPKSSPISTETASFRRIWWFLQGLQRLLPHSNRMLRLANGQQCRDKHSPTQSLTYGY